MKVLDWGGKELGELASNYLLWKNLDNLHYLDFFTCFFVRSVSATNLTLDGVYSQTTSSSD